MIINQKKALTLLMQDLLYSYTLMLSHLLFFKSKRIGVIFNKIDMVVKIQNAVLIVGTTSNNPAQSSVSKASDIILYDATRVNAVKDKPNAIAIL